MGKLLYDDTIYNELEALVIDLRKHPWKLFWKTKRNQRRNRYENKNNIQLARIAVISRLNGWADALIAIAGILLWKKIILHLQPKQKREQRYIKMSRYY